MGFDFRVIDENLIKKHISIQNIIDRVEETYKWYSEGKIIAPAKITTDLGLVGISSWINAMPSYVQPCDTLGIKWAGGFSENRFTGQPYIKSVILISNSKSGKLENVVEGDWISDMRTGAQTAVAAKYLAIKDPKIVCFIGAGAQSFATALCLNQMFKLHEIRIFDQYNASSQKFLNNANVVMDIPIIISHSIEEAVMGSDIIVTATDSTSALVKEKWVKEGALISSIGSYQELEDDLIFKADKLYVDHLEQNIHRGEFAFLIENGKLNKDDIFAEIGDVITLKKSGRTNSKERIIISPIGMGALDISIVGQLLEKME